MLLHLGKCEEWVTSFMCFFFFHDAYARHGYNGNTSVTTIQKRREEGGLGARAGGVAYCLILDFVLGGRRVYHIWFFFSAYLEGCGLKRKQLTPR